MTGPEPAALRVSSSSTLNSKQKYTDLICYREIGGPWTTRLEVGSGEEKKHASKCSEWEWPSLVESLVRDSKEKLHSGTFAYEWSKRWPAKDLSEHKPCKHLTNAIKNYVETVRFDAEGYMYLVANDCGTERQRSRVQLHD